jgi:hypothetical protein
MISAAAYKQNKLIAENGFVYTRAFTSEKIPSEVGFLNL